MKVNEVLTEGHKITEAPMGYLKQAGTALMSKIPGSIGSHASGKLEVGQYANEMKKQLFHFLGRTGQKATEKTLLQFLQQQGYPTTAAKQALPGARIAPTIGATSAPQATKVAKPNTAPDAIEQDAASRRQQKQTLATKRAEDEMAANAARPKAAPAPQELSPAEVRARKQTLATKRAEDEMAANAARPKAAPAPQELSPAEVRARKQTLATKRAEDEMAANAARPKAAPAPQDTGTPTSQLSQTANAIRKREARAKKAKEKKTLTASVYEAIETPLTRTIIDKAILAAAQEFYKQGLQQPTDSQTSATSPVSSGAKKPNKVADVITALQKMKPEDLAAVKSFLNGD